MAISEPPELVSFDAQAALERGRDVVGDKLLTCVEFTGDEIHPMFVQEQVLAMYDGREHMMEHFYDIQSYFHVDTGERELMEREIAKAGEVRYFVTRMELATMARIQALEEKGGLWVTLTPDAPVTRTLDEMYEAGFPDRETSASPYK